MNMAQIVESIGSFITVVGTNSVLSSVIILLIAAAVGGIAFRTIKRFVK